MAALRGAAVGGKRPSARDCLRRAVYKNEFARDMLDAEPPKMDMQQAFLLYAGFCGDVERTAHALGIEAIDVLRMADEDGWHEKLAPILKLKKSERPGDVERAINRTINFVQAHRLRLVLDRLVHKLSMMSDDELKDYCLTEEVQKHRNGTESNVRKLSTRAFTDLAAALEKTHHMLYYALADSMGERDRRKEDGDGPSSGEIHSAIAESMAKVGRATPVRSALLQEQLEQGENTVKAAMAARDRGYDPPPPLVDVNVKLKSSIPVE